MPTVARVIDANANRARESLRVLEDAARFVLNDAALAERVKFLRHALQGALAVLPAGWLEAHRDAAHDVGQAITGAYEGERAGYHAVVVAAGKRLGEALRSIEECMKVCTPGGAPAIERVRYQAYAVEAAIVLRFGSAARRQWGVAVLLTEALCARDWREVLAAAIEGGACCIQVREKNMPTRELMARVRTVVAAAQRAGVATIVNDRVDIAIAAGADGVHLGADDMPVEDARRLTGGALIIGASTHSLSDARAAVAAGADYCGVGAMFATTTKPGAALQGVAYLRAYLEHCGSVPHLAIGGITPANIAQIVAVGGRGVAVSSCVCGAADPATVVRALCTAIAAAPPVSTGGEAAH